MDFLDCVGPAIADHLTVYGRMVRKSGPFGNQSSPAGRTTRSEPARGPIRPGAREGARAAAAEGRADDMGHRDVEVVEHGGRVGGVADRRVRPAVRGAAVPAQVE